MGLLTKISKNRGAAAEPASKVTTSVAKTGEPVEIWQRVPPPIALPPPIPCLICDCPGVWISIYDVDEPAPQLRCPECQPPPAWSMVAGLWLLAGDPGAAAGHRWELSPRFAKSTALADRSGDGGDDAAVASDSPAAQPINRLAELDRDLQPLATLTGRDGSQFTFYGRYSHGPGPGWSDLIRLWLRHGEERAWSMLQERTELFFTKKFVEKS